MDRKFLTAFVLPEYFQIECFKLRPLCAKSLIALHAVKSPFTTGKIDNFTAEDVIGFLRICSVDFDGLFKLKDLTWRQQYFFYKMKYWPPFLARVLIQIKIFVEESTATPLVRMKQSKHSKKESVLVDNQSLPDLLMMVTLLMSKIGMSEREALETPIGRAACYAVAFAAMEGGEIAVVPEEEQSDSTEDIKRKMKEHAEWRANKLRLAMANGELPTKKVKVR